MALAPAPASPLNPFAAVDAIKGSFDKQISAGSTVIPDTDDFARASSADQDVDACMGDEVDVYEAKGGMVDRLAWQLPKPAEAWRKYAMAPMFLGSQEVDFYESRGGLSEQLRLCPAMDEYECRGGLAAEAQCRLPQGCAAQCLPRASEGDEYEMRGGMATWEAGRP